MKKIDLNRSVYDNVTEYPELAEILFSLGFKDVVNKAILHSMGRIMTIPKACDMKKISFDAVKDTLRENGFVIAELPQERTTLLKQYLSRLGEGENLESVRRDFVENFSGVDASEIMKAEQELIAEGTPVEEIQKLCDLHSALFHGRTTSEMLMSGNATVPLMKQMDSSSRFRTLHDNTKDSAKEMTHSVGHPLYTFTMENRGLERLLSEARTAFENLMRDRTEENETVLKGCLRKLREVSIHYAKKGDLLYPHLKVKYEIFGPSSVMWTIDDEIRDELAAIERSGEWNARFSDVLTRMEEMIYKEDHILFPVCAEHFSHEEWQQIYKDSKDYPSCFGVENEIWDAGEKANLIREKSEAEEVVMPGGHMTVEELTAMLNTIPLEITFVDSADINKFFNEGPKVFKRPAMAIDRDVYSCHPPKIETMVRGIIEDFRSGKRDRVPIWMEKNGSHMLVTYMAVRSKQGEYLGTLELVQDMDEARAHFLKEFEKRGD